MSKAGLLEKLETRSEATGSERRRQDYLRSLAAYASTVFLCLLAVCFVMDLWHADLTIPLHGSAGDVNVIAAGVKNLVENGGWFTNRFLGAPGHLDLYDFPFFYGFNHLLVMKFLALFTGNYVVVLNLYFLLSFPLAGVTSLFVLRRFGISNSAAILASVLYSSVAYHFVRGEGHFFLALYYLVPLSIMVALWVARGDELFRFQRSAGQWFVSRKGAAAIAICALMAIDNIYYAFFGAWLLIVAAGFARFRYQRRGALPGAAILLTVVALTFGLVMAPNFIYFHHHGHDRQVGLRSPAEAEIYGLKLAQLVLPVTGHRLDAFASFRDDYNNGPLMNENGVASLGLIGSCGFMLLLGWLLFGRDRSSASEFMVMLGTLNLGAVLLGTIGGLGSVFAIVVSPAIRSLNRISIVIAFLAFFAVALMADSVRQRLHGRKGVFAWYGGIVLLMAAGVFDQTTEAMAPPHQVLQAQFAMPADFVGRIEASVPANSMIFQLPYVPFPENAPVNRMSDYDHLLGYLHSRTLRWSYASVRGRESDAWTREVAGKPVDQMINAVVLAGFGGIYVDRFGYEDGAAGLEAQLRQALGTAPIASSDGRLLFFNLGPAADQLHTRYTSAEWQALHDSTLATVPISVTWEPACWALEGTPEDNWHWCPGRGKWFVSNMSGTTKSVTLDMTVSTGYGEAANVRISTPWVTKEVRTNAAGTPVQLSFMIPPGEYPVNFRSDAKTVKAPRETRPIVFRVNNFRLTELSPAAH